MPEQKTPAAIVVTQVQEEKSEERHPITPHALTIPQLQKPVSRLVGFSIKHTKDEQTSPTLPTMDSDATKSNAAAESNKTINQFDLTVAWRTFAQNMPHEEKAMSQRMDQMEPNLISQEEFEVIAENPTMLNQLKGLTHRVEPFLQSMLHHPHIKMKVTMRDLEDRPVVLSKHEQIGKMREENHAFAKLEKYFALSL